MKGGPLNAPQTKGNGLSKTNYHSHFGQQHRRVPKETEGSDPAWFAFAVTIKDGSPFKRIDIVQHFEDHKIQTRPYFAGNIMLQPAYTGMMDASKVISDFPNARKVTIHIDIVF